MPTSTAPTILVTGATGHLGAAVVAQLLRRGPAARIAAFARDEAKAAPLRASGVDVRLGDLDDPASLERAMRGIERVLLISGTDEERGLRQHENAIAAAKGAGVRLLAYTGHALKDRTRLANRLMDRHFETEDLIRASGLAYRLFRNALYLDTVPVFSGGRALETGFALPAGEGRVAFALRSEQGEAIANALAADGPENTITNLTGGEASSFFDVAATLSELSGREVRYTPLEDAEFEAKSLGFMTDIRNVQEDEVHPDLETLLGRPPATLREGLSTLFDLPSST